MASLAIALSSLLFFALAWYNYTRPKSAYRVYNWPMTGEGEVGESVETTYRRRGILFAVFGVFLLLASLFVE